MPENNELAGKIREYTTRAMATPGQIVEENSLPIAEVLPSAAMLLGQEPDELEGFLIIGFRKDGSTLMGGNVDPAETAALLVELGLSMDPELMSRVQGDVMKSLFGSMLGDLGPCDDPTCSVCHADTADDQGETVTPAS
jgi:hypothetical protein